MQMIRLSVIASQIVQLWTKAKELSNYFLLRNSSVIASLVTLGISFFLFSNALDWLKELEDGQNTDLTRLLSSVTPIHHYLSWSSKILVQMTNELGKFLVPIQFWQQLEKFYFKNCMDFNCFLLMIQIPLLFCFSKSRNIFREVIILVDNTSARELPLSYPLTTGLVSPFSV